MTFEGQDDTASKRAFFIPEHLFRGEFELATSNAVSQASMLLDIPFITVTKPDRIGHMADWDNQAGAGPQTGGQAAEDDGQWLFSSIMDTGARQQQQQAGGVAKRPGTRTAMPARPTGPRRGFPPTAAVRRVIRDPSIQPEASWRLLEEVEFSRLSKLSFAPEEPTVVSSNGSAPVIDAAFAKLTAKQERPLGVLEAAPQKTPSVLDDTGFDELIAKEDAASQIVISSDAVLSMLMCSVKTVVPWDIFITKHPRHRNVLVLDKRADSDLDAVLVNETKPDVFNEEKKDNINFYANLAIEASRINANLPTLLTGGKTESMTRYVRWSLGDRLVLIVRGAVNAASDPSTPVLLRGLLEYDWGRGAMDWRRRLDGQKASVVAAELQNNNAQMSRWILSSVLLSVEQIKLAFLSRLNPRDRTRHAILGLHDIDPYELSNQMGVDLSNAFGIVKSFALRFFEGDLQGVQSEVVVMRDAQKAMLRMYARE